VADHRPKLKDLHPELQAVIDALVLPGPNGGPFAFIEPPGLYVLASGVTQAVVIPDNCRWVWGTTTFVTGGNDLGCGDFIIDTDTGTIHVQYGDTVSATAVAVSTVLGSETIVSSNGIDVILSTYVAPVIGVSNGSFDLDVAAITAVVKIGMMG